MSEGNCDFPLKIAAERDNNDVISNLLHQNIVIMTSSSNRNRAAEILDLAMNRITYEDEYLKTLCETT